MITVRDSHRRKFPTPREQDMNLRRTWVQALLNEVIQIIKSASKIFTKHDAWRFLGLLVSISKHSVKCVQIKSFFWSVFSRIRTVYGEIRSVSPYSVQMRENTDQKKLCIWTLFTQWSVYMKDFNPIQDGSVQGCSQMGVKKGQ